MTTNAVIASDIPGSSLTIAFQDFRQDTATRKFLVNANDRAAAITTLTTWLEAEVGGSGNGAAHPDQTLLLANQITCQAVGPERWLLNVQYQRNKSSGFTAAHTIANTRMAFEGLEVFCDTSAFKNGLPFGGSGKSFVHPGPPAGQNKDSKVKPEPWIYNKPVMSIQHPFSELTNPTIVAVTTVGNINDEAVTIGGYQFAIGTVRFDGIDFKSMGTSQSGLGGAVKFVGTRNYTFRLGGFFKQVLTWDEDDGWTAENRPISTNSTNP